MTLTPTRPPEIATRAASPRGPLLRLLLTVVAVAVIFYAFGAGDVFLVILAVVLMVILHEFGHFATAKWSRMKVSEFFVGFGPRLWSVRRGETEYGIKAIPAGGYVKIPGMTNLEEIDPADEARTYRQQPFSKRLLVVSAGSVMHFLIAFVLAWSALTFIGTASNSRVEVAAFDAFPGQARNPAQRAGLHVGDVIVGVDGHGFSDPDQLTGAIERSANRPVTLEVQRAGRSLELRVVPELRRHEVNGKEQTSGEIGVALGTVNVPESPFGAIGGAGVVVGQTTSSAITGLGHLFSPSGISSYVHQVLHPSQATPAQQVNRPESLIGAVRTAVQGAQAGIGSLLAVLIALNIFFGILNMLPMLPLDGGHVAIALYERIRTRRGRPYYQADAAKLLPVAYGFLVLLFFLVLSAAYLDITHPVPNPFG
jgi:membrane-associated protease RseP (regulator of RpoE activity)